MISIIYLEHFFNLINILFHNVYAITLCIYKDLIYI